MSKPRLVYFIKPIGMAGPVKIGCSNLPLNRLDTLTVWSPFPLEVVVSIPGSYDLERNIQECFFDQRVHREWFHASDRLTLLMERLKGGVPIASALDLSDRRGRMAANRKQYTADDKKYLSYAQRVGRMAQKIRSAGYILDAPSDVDAIMGRWSSRWVDGVKQPRITPTAAEFARLDQVLADPERHCKKISIVRRAA